MAGIALTSNFPQLPDDEDPNRVTVFQMIFSQLDSMGIGHPGTPADTITRANMLRHLQQEAGKLLHSELQDARYQGQSDIDAADLLNKPDFKTEKPARVSTVLLGFPFAPNAVSADDVTNCK